MQLLFYDIIYMICILCFALGEYMKIGLIGVGNMGGAIASALLYSELDLDIFLYDRNPPKLESFKDNTSAHVSSCEKDVIISMIFVFLRWIGSTLQ